MNDLVSIIVPIYNVEEYLQKCVDSIICQTYKNIEIILVDDGSTDNSGSICDNYLNKDNRIKVIHKANGGLSDARNAGINSSIGKYIMFIDSDDWIDMHYVEKFYRAIIKFNASIVIGKLKETFTQNVEAQNETFIKKIEKEEVYEQMFLGDGSIISACAKIYEKELFENCRYEVGQLYEDFLIFDKIIEKASDIVVFDYVGYFYLIRENSIMRSSYSDKRWILIDKSLEYMELCNNKYPKLKMAALRRYIFSCFNLLSRTIIDKKHDVISQKLRKMILKYWKEIFGNKEFNKRDVFQTILIFLGISPYRFAMFIYYKYKKNVKKRINHD